MGVLRYFPGSEPEDPEQADEAGSGSPPVGPAVPPNTADGGATWAVPGLERGVAEPVREPERPRPGRRAENVAMTALGRHDLSVAEMRTRLTDRGLEPGDVEAEIDRLRSVGLLDDTALASRLVQSLRERKGLGDAALRPALRARRLDPTAVDEVLAAAPEEPDEVQERLQALADDRAGRLRSLAPDVAERRLTGYLMRKGYSGSGVRAAVRRAFGGGA